MLGDFGEVAVTLGVSDVQLDNVSVFEIGQAEAAGTCSGPRRGASAAAA
jgi:hypothetical protein